MKHLQSSIALRIMDSMGVISNDLPPINHELYKTKRASNVYAAKTGFEEGSSIIALYSEHGDMKYMITRIASDNDNKNKLWFCIACGDTKEENPDLNRIFALNVFDEKYIFRETSIIEIANILVSFECVRNYCAGWSPYDASVDDIATIKDFIKSLKEEDAES